jgi:hypothetical protein
LKGKYKNVIPIDETLPPSPLNNKEIEVEGIFNNLRNLLTCTKSIWFSNAKQRHYLDIPKCGAWTLLIEGKKYHKWGFYVPRKKEKTVRRLRPLAYFSKFGIIQDNDYQ